MPATQPAIPANAHIAAIHIPTAQKIVRATLLAISRHGIDGLTTKIISKRSGLSTGIIHHYFDTKDNLVYASHVFFIRKLQKKIRKTIKHETNLNKRLWKIIMVHFGDVQLSREAANIWPHLWSYAIHNKRAARLQHIYSRRLISNFASIFCQLGYAPDEAVQRARQLVFFLHGIWVEYRVSHSIDGKQALYDVLKQHLKLFIGASPPKGIF